MYTSEEVFCILAERFPQLLSANECDHAITLMYWLDGCFYGPQESKLYGLTATCYRAHSLFRDTVTEFSPEQQQLIYETCLAAFVSTLRNRDKKIHSVKMKKFGDTK